MSEFDMDRGGFPHQADTDPVNCIDDAFYQAAGRDQDISMHGQWGDHYTLNGSPGLRGIRVKLLLKTNFKDRAGRDHGRPCYARKQTKQSCEG